MKKIRIKDLSDIERAAKEFVDLVKGCHLIAFYGNMGAGKTTFVKAVCSVLGVEDVVNSPTFTIVNEYRTKAGMPVFHFDFYRIERVQEVIDLGFDEYIYGDGICLMEWPERIEEILPEDTLRVHILVNDDDSREIVINNI